ncbi:30S ribosome-binding factor RbfA [bacterium]|nr:30S ribosome-binding factor RbfA [candidate division CSSED10-310 bacterium]
MASRRIDRVSHLVHQSISELLIRKIKDPRVKGLTVTRVSMSADLRQANIYVVGHDNRPEKIRQVMAALQRAAGFIRANVGTKLTLRYVPQFTFHYDLGFEEGSRILDTIADLFADGENLDAQPDTLVEPEEEHGDGN